MLLGAVGLRQVDAAQLHRRAARHHRRADLDQGQERHLGGAEGPRHRHGVPVLRALPADDRAREPGFGLKNAGLPQRRDREAHRARRRRSCRSSRCSTASPRRSPAASASASRSAGRWCATSTCSCSTSRLSNLDAKLRSELRVEIKRLHQNLENTMIYVTHDQIEALTLADRIAVMRGGIIQQLADPKTIYNKPSNLFVAGFIGSPAMNFLKGEIVDADGGQAFRCRRHRRAARRLRRRGPGARRARGDPRRPARSTSRSARADGEGLPASRRHRRADGLGQPGLADARRAAVSVRATADHGSGTARPVQVGFDIRKASLFDQRVRAAALRRWPISPENGGLPAVRVASTS